MTSDVKCLVPVTENTITIYINKYGPFRAPRRPDLGATENGCRRSLHVIYKEKRYKPHTVYVERARALEKSLCDL